MGIEFNPVTVPHRQLSFRIPTIGLSGQRILRPHLEWIEQIQLPHQVSRSQLPKSTYEISVDVVGMIFVFSKGSIPVNLADSDLPKLLRQNFEVIDQSSAPPAVPGAQIRSC